MPILTCHAGTLQRPRSEGRKANKLKKAGNGWVGPGSATHPQDLDVYGFCFVRIIFWRYEIVCASLQALRPLQQLRMIWGPKQDTGQLAGEEGYPSPVDCLGNVVSASSAQQGQTRSSGEVMLSMTSSMDCDGCSGKQYETHVMFCRMQVEVRLADKEEQSLEKDLIYQQVCRLTERVSSKVEAGKDDTLLLAKKV